MYDNDNYLSLDHHYFSGKIFEIVVEKMENLKQRPYFNADYI